MEYKSKILEAADIDFHEVIKCIDIINDCIESDNIKVPNVIAALHNMLASIHLDIFKSNYEDYKDMMLTYINHYKKLWESDEPK